MRNALETCLPGVLLSSGFGPWLKEEREKRGWSQDQLGLRADLTKATVSRFETGVRDPQRESVEVLARALAHDDATESEIETLTADALLAAGFVPPGGMPELTRQIDEETLFEYLDGYNGTDPRVRALKSVAESIDEALRYGKLVTPETPEDELSGQE